MAATFQAVCWRGEDVEESEEDVEDGEGRKQYKIFIFGKTSDGTSVCCITDFYPFFYISLPKGFSKTDAALLRDSLVAKLGRTFREDVVTEACITVTRKKFYGFTAGEPTAFLRMVFRTRHAFAVANKVWGDHLQGNNMELYESNVDPVLKLMHCRNLDSAGWIRVSGGTRSSTTRLTTCALEITARYDALERETNATRAAPLVLASFDIESYSRDGGFPNPDEDGNDVIQIAVVFQRYGEPDPYARHVLCLGETDHEHARCFRHETDLLAAWTDLIRREHTDVLVGYNIWGFDMEYMYKRAMFHFDAEDNRRAFLECGKMRETQSALRKIVLSSSAYGHNEFLVLETPGILQIDLLHVLRKEHKLESYSLNNVSKHFLKDAKVDLPIKKMFELYRGGVPADRGIIADYCVKDAELPLRIMDKLAVLSNMIEMAKATYVPMEFLIPRGQQIKVFSQILKRLRDRGYLCPTNPAIGGGAEYTGATVLEPLRGAYFDVIAGLDFASLYPTIMRAHRLCHSTIVLDRAYADLPGVAYETLDVEGRQYTFAQTEDAILPELLKDLAEFRKAAKKNMARAKADGNEFMAGVYNGQQLAYKISMNSIYGFCGAANGFLPCPPIAAAVTSIGRTMILRTKAFVEANYPGSTVVYGDSVMPYTPIFVKDAGTGDVRIRPIEDLFAEKSGQFLSQGTAKERCDLSGMLTWTHMGWQPIRRVIRHRSGKRIYRVVTHTAIVDVTEDHSLIAADGATLLKPTDVGVGTELLHGLPPDIDAVRREETASTWVSGQYEFLLGRRESGVDIITSIEVIHESWDGYVYDLETAAGSFQAGIGGLIVKNTDSVMVKFPSTDMAECFRLGQEAADAITRIFRKPIQLEFEKCYSPYFLFSKKRYCGLMYTKPTAPDAIDAKGIQLVRRDNCPLVRSVSQTVLDALMYDRDPAKATEIVREAARRLLRRDVDVRDLVLSKTLKPEKSYKNPNQPHVHVARSIERRNGIAGSGPKSGERVPYVFVQSEDPQALQYTKAEDPEHVIANDLRIDVLYYLEHQLESPMITLFELLLDDPHAALFADIKEAYVEERKRAIVEFKRRSKLKRDKQREITDFFSSGHVKK